MSSARDALVVLRFAAQNSYYAKAVQTPEHLAAIELRDEAIIRRDQLRSTATPPPPAPTTIKQLDAFIKATTEAAEEQRNREHLHTTLSAVIASCEQTIAAATHVFPDRTLASLNTDMNQLMNEVDTVATELAGATTPEEAIAANKAKPWNKLSVLRGNYDTIRAAQQHILGHSWYDNQSHYLDDPLANLVAIRNIDDVFPHWRDADTSRTYIHGAAPDPRPWPVDPVQQLLWLATSDAQPWVPTSAQLDQANEQRRERTRHPAGVEPTVYPGFSRTT